LLALPEVIAEEVDDARRGAEFEVTTARRLLERLGYQVFPEQPFCALAEVVGAAVALRRGGGASGERGQPAETLLGALSSNVQGLP
jgi:hypothetical protein